MVKKISGWFLNSGECLKGWTVRHLKLSEIKNPAFQADIPSDFQYYRKIKYRQGLTLNPLKGTLVIRWKSPLRDLGAVYYFTIWMRFYRHFRGLVLEF
jgi:hypothetical protein